MASYELGDDPWSVGCRAYAFGRHRLRRAAEAGAHNWLGVLDDSTQFVFLIEDVPVRSGRARPRHEEEARQLSLALGEDAQVTYGRAR